MTGMQLLRAQTNATLVLLVARLGALLQCSFLLTPDARGLHLNPPSYLAEKGERGGLSAPCLVCKCSVAICQAGVSLLRFAKFFHELFGVTS